MPYKVPNRVGLINPLFLLCQFAIIFLFYCGYNVLGFGGLGLGESWFFAAITYATIASVLRKKFVGHHRKGVRLVRHRKFYDAISFFEKSVAFLSKHKWVDKYRFITFFSSIGISFKEMGIYYIAFCYSQLGEGEKAIHYCKEVLKENPKNTMAVILLNMITSHQNPPPPSPFLDVIDR